MSTKKNTEYFEGLSYANLNKEIDKLLRDIVKDLARYREFEYRAASRRVRVNSIALEKAFKVYRKTTLGIEREDT